MSILVSIIIPVYNAEKYLEQCIDSILQQDFNSYEVLLINDGSSDSSGQICDNYAKLYESVQVYHQANQGVSVARNVGINSAKGEYIMFVDADDFLLPNSIFILYSSAKGKNVDLVLSGSLTYNGKSLSKFKSYTPSLSYSPIIGATHPALWSYIFRRSIIEKNSIWFNPNLAHSEDRLFISLYASYCKSLQVIEDNTYVYRVVLSSVTHCSYTIKSANDHFLAASELEHLVLPRCSNKSEIKCIKKHIKSLKSMSYRGYVRHYLSFSTFPSFKKMYLKYFSNTNALYFGILTELFRIAIKKLIKL